MPTSYVCFSDLWITILYSLVIRINSFWVSNKMSRIEDCDKSRSTPITYNLFVAYLIISFHFDWHSILIYDFPTRIVTVFGFRISWVKLVFITEYFLLHETGLVFILMSVYLEYTIPILIIVHIVMLAIAIAIVYMF